MSKLSDAQVKVLESVHNTGELPKGTRQTTLTKLREELGFLLVTRVGDETNYTLTTEGREAIGVVTPVETTESVEEDAPVPFFNRAARRGFRRNVARYNRALMRLKGKRTKRFGSNVVIKHAA